MMVVGSERRAKPRPRIDEIEQLKQLIAIQNQIVELAKQNELTQKECEAMRQELSQNIRSSRRRNSSFAQLARSFFKRLKNSQL